MVRACAKTSSGLRRKDLRRRVQPISSRNPAPPTRASNIEASCHARHEAFNEMNPQAELLLGDFTHDASTIRGFQQPRKLKQFGKLDAAAALRAFGLTADRELAEV